MKVYPKLGTQVLNKLREKNGEIRHKPEQGLCELFSAVTSFKVKRNTIFKT